MPLNVIITGSTGMVGKGVLLECLESPEVNSILLINRKPAEVQHPKVREVLVPDIRDIAPLGNQLVEYNACFFCMGVSAIGLSEKEYTDVTYSLTLTFAQTLYAHNPSMVFIYVSGQGADASEQGRIMWARVKGRTENAILAMRFKDAYAFRPGVILPEKGVKSRTGWYNAFYVLTRPFFPLLKKLRSVTTSARVGRAMIHAATRGTTKKHLENADINVQAGNNLSAFSTSTNEDGRVGGDRLRGS